MEINYFIFLTMYNNIYDDIPPISDVYYKQKAVMFLKEIIQTKARFLVTERNLRKQLKQSNYNQSKRRYMLSKNDIVIIKDSLLIKLFDITEIAYALSTILFNNFPNEFNNVVVEYNLMYSPSISEPSWKKIRERHEFTIACIANADVVHGPLKRKIQYIDIFGGINECNFIEQLKHEIAKKTENLTTNRLSLSQSVLSFDNHVYP